MERRFVRSGAAVMFVPVPGAVTEAVPPSFSTALAVA
jgi:hypothetical protein